MNVSRASQKQSLKKVGTGCLFLTLRVLTGLPFPVQVSKESWLHSSWTCTSIREQTQWQERGRLRFCLLHSHWDSGHHAEDRLLTPHPFWEAHGAGETTGCQSEESDASSTRHDRSVVSHFTSDPQFPLFYDFLYLCGCAESMQLHRLSLTMGSRGPFLVAIHRLLIVTTSGFAEDKL